jgi:hypothetical protein
MEPRPNNELPDDELSAMLSQWEPPEPPARLRAKVFGDQPVSRWRWLWSGSIRLPIPAAVAIAAVLALAIRYRPAPAPPQPRTIVRTERVEVPVVKERIVTKVVYRDRPAPPSPQPAVAASHTYTFRDFQPVTTLQARIIRSGSAQ